MTRLLSAIALSLTLSTANAVPIDTSGADFTSYGVLDNGAGSFSISNGSIAPGNPTGSGLTATLSSAPGNQNSAIDVANFLGVDPLLLNHPSALAFEGSALKVSNISVNAGDQFSFDWNWNSVQPSFDPVNVDFAKLFIELNSTLFSFDLVTNAGNNLLDSGSFDGFTSQASGVMTFGIAVMDGTQAIFNSILDVSNFELTSTQQPPVVSEPGSIALLGLALGLAGFYQRRRRNS